MITCRCWQTVDNLSDRAVNDQKSKSRDKFKEIINEL